MFTTLHNTATCLRRYLQQIHHEVPWLQFYFVIDVSEYFPMFLSWNVSYTVTPDRASSDLGAVSNFSPFTILGNMYSHSDKNCVFENQIYFWICDASFTGNENI